MVGAISYTGLFVPSLAAMLKGDRIQGTLIGTTLFVPVCNMVGRMVIFPYAPPIELITGSNGVVRHAVYPRHHRHCRDRWYLRRISAHIRCIHV